MRIGDDLPYPYPILAYREFKEGPAPPVEYTYEQAKDLGLLKVPPYTSDNLIHTPKAEDPSTGMDIVGMTSRDYDPINHPVHYTSSPAVCSNCRQPIECIDIIEHMPLNVGSAIKYLWRRELKGDLVENLRKAKWFVEREIQRVVNGVEAVPPPNKPEPPAFRICNHLSENVFICMCSYDCACRLHGGCPK